MESHNTHRVATQWTTCDFYKSWFEICSSNQHISFCHAVQPYRVQHSWKHSWQLCCSYGILLQKSMWLVITYIVNNNSRWTYWIVPCIYIFRGKQRQFFTLEGAYIAKSFQYCRKQSGDYRNIQNTGECIYSYILWWVGALVSLVGMYISDFKNGDFVTYSYV